jgi:DNA repair exonuclease SbcCD ATPase subunit
MSKADGILNITETKEKISEIDDKMMKVKEASQKTMEEDSEIQKKHDELWDKIGKIRNTKHKREMIANQIESTKREIETLENALNQNQSQENPFEGLIESNKTQISEYDKLMSEKSTNIKIKKFIEMVFNDGGAKKAILNDISSNINKLIHHYLIKLGANYTVILDSSFTPKFITQNGESAFESFSSGEKQRINLATMMAFRDLVIGNRISSNVFILDEVIDGALDSSGLIGITTAIVEMISNSNTKLMLVSHNPSVEQKLKELSNVSLVIAEKRESKTKYKIVD